jgi:uncharacterized protein YcbK (DUF882 family)|tara:strand:+ start:2994 stop:3344 length:351 start_codon:yes stop_codon:yes gene_type:complete
MKLKYFSMYEFDCQVTEENRMEEDFLKKLDRLREGCGFPFVVTSGYRHPVEHPIEAAKEVPGTHAQGIACDIKITNANERYKFISEALSLGFTGIGVAKDFIHVDTRGTTPVVWLY